MSLNELERLTVMHDEGVDLMVSVPTHLARPITIFLDDLYRLDVRGQLARAIELLLVGLAEPDSSCVLAGLRDATMAASQLARSPDEVAAQVAEESTVCPSPRPHLILFRGGRTAPLTVEVLPDTTDAT